MRVFAAVFVIGLVHCGGGAPPDELRVDIPVKHPGISRAIEYQAKTLNLIEDIGERSDGELLVAGTDGIAQLRRDTPPSVHQYQRRPLDLGDVLIASAGDEFLVLAPRNGLQAFGIDGQVVWHASGRFGYTLAVAKVGGHASRVYAVDQQKGLLVYDVRTGEPLPTRFSATPPEIRAADLNGDGTSELLMMTELGLTAYDLAGKQLARVPAVASWAVLQSERREEIALLGNDSFVVYGENLKALRRFPRQFRGAEIPSLHLRAATHYESRIYAFLVGGRGGWHRTSLLMYDERGTVLYHEVFGDDCRTLHVTSHVPRRLLVGCRDELIAFTLPRSAA